MMSVFFKNIDTTISWKTLINDVNQETEYNPYCISKDYYNIFKYIILSMLKDIEVMLLDSDFSEYELKQLTNYSDFEKFKVLLKKLNPPLQNKSDLILKLRSTSENWKITLFTSGTTGVPKSVTHNFNSVTRFVKYSKSNENSVWGYAYNPTHMAGLQVFLQALLNGNSIINLFQLPAEKICREIKNNKITHISATPTFYKQLLACNKSFDKVKRVTSGGEKLSKKNIERFSKIFPNAKITNVYASTEAGTLFASENDVFTIKSDFKHLVKIEDNELFIHNSLLGKSELKVDEWYNTGDLTEPVSGDPFKFRFVSRKDELINVGGYKVDPNEVEEYISMIPGVKDVRVFAKNNSVLGNIVSCEVVCKNRQLEESEIRLFLQSKLQEYKIPRMIIFTDKISVTRTGKTKRI
jgi:acyl-coenzyme A synthetase/AMP-(fatty) acid ligase